jgi:hypothetical protein
MTKFVGTPLRGIAFSTVSDEAVSALVSGDAFPRIRIDAGGRLTWSSGSATGDTTLYRSAANTLFTDDVFQSALGLVTLTTAGAPSTTLPDGAMAIDTTNNSFYFRSGSTWQQVSASGTSLSGDVDGDNVYAEPLEAEVTNHVVLVFNGGAV